MQLLDSGYNNVPSLPMTGDDLILYVIVAAAIIAMGFALRFVSSR